MDSSSAHRLMLYTPAWFDRLLKGRPPYSAVLSDAAADEVMEASIISNTS